jgi:anhydro-N-acetylmuramic acid kinase
LKLSASDPNGDGLFLGLISGTSMDGVDAVLIEIADGRCRTLDSLTHRYPESLHRGLHGAISPKIRLSLHEIATLNIEVGEWFANAASQLLNRCGVRHASVVAIGSHGQTLRHAPRAEWPYSIQIGSPAVIAARSGITTVADFRSMDIAYGGEGAPLVPAFHEWVLRTSIENLAVANIGGIANLSLLPASSDIAISGYDTGPGNCLLDSWNARHRGQAFDESGNWAASGTVHRELLMALLRDPYYAMASPKSTGREVFNLDYLERVLAMSPVFSALRADDVQATLAELTVETLAREVEKLGAGWTAKLLICGGGSRNTHLMRRLAQRLAPIEVMSTASVGVDPDMVEASAFAWLAYMRLQARPVRVTTGAAGKAVILGAVYRPTPES